MVKLYTQDNCAPCDAVKKYLKMKNVQFEELDRANYAEEMMRIAGTISTPVVHTDKGVMVGLNYSRLAQII